MIKRRNKTHSEEMYEHKMLLQEKLKSDRVFTLWTYQLNLPRGVRFINEFSLLWSVNQRYLRRD